MTSVTLMELGIDEPWLFTVLKAEVMKNKPSGCTDVPQMRQDSVDPDSTMVKHPPDSDGEDQRELRRRSSALNQVLGSMTIDELYEMANCDAETISVSGFSVLSQRSSSSTNDGSFCMLGKSLDRGPSPSLHRPPSYSEVQEEAPPPEYSLYSRNTAENTVESRCIEILKSIVQEGSVLGKLKQITKCYRFIANHVSHLTTTGTMDQSLACCDELLSVLIVLLTYLDQNMFQRLYAHMRLVIDLLPKFMVGSVHDCSLTNLHAAFQYLSDRVVMQQTRESTEITQ